MMGFLVSKQKVQFLLESVIFPTDAYKSTLTSKSFLMQNINKITPSKIFSTLSISEFFEILYNLWFLISTTLESSINSWSTL